MKKNKNHIKNLHVGREKSNFMKKWFIHRTFNEKLYTIRNCFLHASLKKKIIFFILLIGATLLVRQAAVQSKSKGVAYETAKAEKGTLITSISGSGSITSGNNTNIITKTSGVVEKVYVTNGDDVVKRQKIAEVTLDDYAKERQSATWVLYLEATEAVKDAKKAKVTADIAMWQDRQDLLDAETTYKNMVAGAWNPTTNKEYTYNEKAIITKQYEEAKLSFDSSELKYTNSSADISNAYAKEVSAFRTYQENSATIVAPSSGVISDLALAEGIIVSANSTTSSTSGATIVSTQTVGKISNPKGQLIASVNLTEIDVINVKAKQKVTLTLDAYSDKTFTGKVLAVNTNGSVNSGVTSYPVTILLDPVTTEIYPNMSVNAEIITNIVSDVVIIPTTAITTSNGISLVQIKKDGNISTVEVEIGLSNDSQTEIKLGITEGDEVITSIISADTTDSSNVTGTSPFSGLGRTSGSSGGSSSSQRSIQIQGPPGGF